MRTVTPLRVSLGQGTHGSAEGYAREKLGLVLGRAPEPVLSARVRITRQRQPANPEPFVGQVNIDLNGRLVRVQVCARDEWGAVDLLEERLNRQLERVSRHWEAIRGRTQDTRRGEWHHSDLPAQRADYFPRPPEERRLVRHKSYAYVEWGCDEAAFEMDLMDYAFHLFIESGTGQDTVIYRSAPTGYRVAQVHPDPANIMFGAVDVTVSSIPASEMTPDEAITRLELSGMPFVFFQDRDSGRGNVLYHRYDGHYGLITPPADLELDVSRRAPMRD